MQPLPVRKIQIIKFLGNFKINHLTTKNTLQLVQLSGNNFDAEKKQLQFLYFYSLILLLLLGLFLLKKPMIPLGL